MRQTLSDFYELGVGVYIDDIFIFSDTFEEHLSTLDLVFRKLAEENFTIILLWIWKNAN